jgi:hypothetical protein
METYTPPKKLVENPEYGEQRQKYLSELSDAMVDAPIIDVIQGLNALPFCFTLQCCYGHFLYRGQTDPNNLAPLPKESAMAGNTVRYRIAYIAFCVECSQPGRALLEALKSVTAIDPANIQFCCAEWFWQRSVNSYALQVEPDRFKDRDWVDLAYDEALEIERVRNAFFNELKTRVSGCGNLY